MAKTKRRNWRTKEIYFVAEVGHPNVGSVLVKGIEFVKGQPMEVSKEMAEELLKNERYIFKEVI